MKSASPKLIFALLVALAFTLATSAHLRAISRPDAIGSDGAFKKLLGDGRRLFAGQFVEMADVYLHSGYYPSIFDRKEASSPKAVSGKTEEPADHAADQEQAHAGHQHDAQGNCIPADTHKAHAHDEHGNCVHSHDEPSAAAPHDAHEKAMAFHDEPRDWLEGFIRRFRITKHTHLEANEAREILPWLKLAIELDPQAIETYTATAYWLRHELDRPQDAQTVLREGIRNNPNSSEILFEMGVIYKEVHHDLNRARNIWVLALRRWYEQTDEAKSASTKSLGQITVNLARLEKDAGNWERAIHYFELTKLTSPNPEAIQKQIEELRPQLSRPPTAAPTTTPIP